MNKQEQKIYDLKIVVKEKNAIITSLVENSKSQTITSKVLLDRLIEQDIELNNIKSHNNDIIVKQLLYDYNFTINGYNCEIFGSDKKYLKICEKLTFSVIEQIKKIYNIN